MSVQILASDQGLLNDVQQHLRKVDIKYNHVITLENLYLKSMQECSRSFVIQANFDSKLRMQDLIRDLRMLFGSFPSIIFIGKNIDGEEIAQFYDLGIDLYMNWPIDMGLLKDFFSKDVEKELCLPFKYRNVPSGGSVVQLSFPIYMQSISSNGVSFHTNDLITKGTIFEIDLGPILKVGQCKVSCKVLLNKLSEQKDYEYFAEFFEISKEMNKKIIHHLKNS